MSLTPLAFIDLFTRRPPPAAASSRVDEALDELDAKVLAVGAKNESAPSVASYRADLQRSRARELGAKRGLP